MVGTMNQWEVLPKVNLTEEELLRPSAQPRKFYGVSFKGMKLKHAPFQLHTFKGCDFTDTDLAYGNLTGAHCYGSNFTGANLYRANMTDCELQDTIFYPRDCFGMTITLRCDTYQGMEIDPIWLQVWQFIPCVMKLPERKENGNIIKDYWLNKIIAMIGSSAYLKMKQIFSNRVI